MINKFSLVETLSLKVFQAIQGVPEKNALLSQTLCMVAFFNLNFLRDACAESWASWAQMKNVKLACLAK